VKNEKIWYELDAFAKTYSSIISEGRTTCFRLSALFSENIDLKVLRNVAVLLERKYPFYNSELKKGIFWNYLQQKKTHFMIEEDSIYVKSVKIIRNSNIKLFDSYDTTKSIVFHDFVSLEFELDVYEPLVDEESESYFHFNEKFVLKID